MNIQQDKYCERMRGTENRDLDPTGIWTTPRGEGLASSLKVNNAVLRTAALRLRCSVRAGSTRSIQEPPKLASRCFPRFTDSVQFPPTSLAFRLELPVRGRPGASRGLFRACQGPAITTALPLVPHRNFELGIKGGEPPTITLAKHWADYRGNPGIGAKVPSNHRVSLMNQCNDILGTVYQVQLAISCEYQLECFLLPLLNIPERPSASLSPSTSTVHAALLSIYYALARSFPSIEPSPRIMLLRPLRRPVLWVSVALLWLLLPLRLLLLSIVICLLRSQRRRPRRWWRGDVSSWDKSWLTLRLLLCVLRRSVCSKALWLSKRCLVRRWRSWTSHDIHTK